MSTTDDNHQELILNSLPELIMLVDAKTWQVLYINEQMAKNIRVKKEDILGKNILNYLPKNTPNSRVKYAQQMIKEGKLVNFEDKRGNRWFRTTYYPIKNAQGKVNYGLVVAQDITKKKTIDGALEKSQEQYKDLVNNLNDGVSTLDNKGNFIFVNDVIIKRSGRSLDEWKHINIYDIVYPEYHTIVRKAFKDLFNGKKIAPFELAYKSATGKIYTEVSGRFKIEDNKVTSIHAITRDITDKKKAEDALKASEKKYRQLINIINDAIFTLDKNGKITYLNKIAEDHIGMPASKWSKISFFKLALPEYQDLVKKNFQKVLKGESVPPFVITYQNKQKKKVFIELNTGPIVDNKNDIIGVHGISRDISYRMKILQELKRSEELYRTLLQTSPDPIVVTDLQGKILRVSSESLKMYGADSEKGLIGINAFSLVPPEELPNAEILYKKTLENGYVKGFELKALRKDNTSVFYEINTGLLKDTNNQPYAFFGIYRDVTERKQSEEKLQESEEKYRTIFNTSVGAILLTDAQGIVTDLNPAATKIIEYDDPKEIIGRPTIERYAFPEQRNLLLKKLQENGYVTNYEITFLKKDGSHVHCIGSIGFLRNINGKIIGTIGSFQDITPRVKAEQEIKQTKEYLKKVIDSTTDLIFTINNVNRIQTWNKTAEKISGYSERSLKGKNINKLPVFTEPKQILSIIEKTFTETPSETYEILLNTKDDDHRLLTVKTTLMKDDQQKNMAILFTAQDISEKRDSHKRLEFGKGYLILDDDRTEAQYLFHNLVTDNITGLHITRFTSKHPQSKDHNKKIQTAFLSHQKTQKDHHHHIQSLDELLQYITTFVTTNRNAVVFLDRLDYLISLYSFEKVLQTIYRIHDQIKVHHGLILFRIPKDILSSTHQALLFEELSSIPEPDIDTVNMSDDLFNILTYVKCHTTMNEQITFNKVEKSQQISKVTTRKRLLELQNLGLIRIRSLGRKKSVHLTDKGKILLEKRRIL